mmetsp:Transcript_13120/g.20379  ORF Transcript_13120/g.20379 Transcript_13120/m.20379 type:complete len:82 (-) Transcript_13120:2505-2750(-)
MMRRFYRNRHATFIKALLDEKKQKEEASSVAKEKEQRKKQKLKTKVLASMAQNPAEPETQPGSRNSELPQINQVLHVEQEF